MTKPTITAAMVLGVLRAHCDGTYSDSSGWSLHIERGVSEMSMDDFAAALAEGLNASIDPRLTAEARPDTDPLDDGPSM